MRVSCRPPPLGAQNGEEEEGHVEKGIRDQEGEKVPAEMVRMTAIHPRM